MKFVKNVRLLGLSVLVLAGLSACDQRGPPGPAESAGKKIDQSVDAAGRTIDQTIDAAGRKLDQTVDSAGRKLDQTASAAGRKMDEAAGAVGEKINEKIGEQSARTSVVLEDTEITARVKASIFAEPGLRTLQIRVDTVQGVVTLTGSVDTLANSDKARALAAAVAGVTRVDNMLMHTS